MQFYRDFEIWQIGNRFAEGFKRFCRFFDLNLVFLGIEPGTLRSKGQRVNCSATRTERAWAKKFYCLINMVNLSTPWPSG